VKLQINELEVSFGSRRVAHVPQLTIETGQIIGIVGESGSGKSMTAASILGFADKLGARVRGSVRLDDLELVGATSQVLRTVCGSRMAMIFQSPATAFNPVLRVGETFFRAMSLHGEKSRSARADRARAAMAQVMLPDSALRRYPHQLSGGQLQRMAIALALALRVELLVADEPTSALDVTVQAELLDLIKALRDREGLAVLLISHDMGVIAETCDTVVVMQAGEVVETGPANQVIGAPDAPYTRELIASVPELIPVRAAAEHTDNGQG